MGWNYGQTRDGGMQTTDIWEAHALATHVPGKTQPQDSPGKVHLELEGIYLCGQG